jgi:surface protein
MKTFIHTAVILFSLAFLSQNIYGQDNESVWFVTKWKTDNPGTSNSTSITIPTGPGATYNYNVDWNNDGVADQLNITGSVTHNFGSPGTYFIRISGIFPRIYFNYVGDRSKLLEVNQWGTGLWTSMAWAFAGCKNMNINANDAPNLSMATSMEVMFGDATNLNADLSAWNVSTITNMALLFNSATNFNGALNSWNVANVTNMRGMFSYATSFNQAISNWNVSNVTNMSSMFQNATSFNQAIGNWNVGKVTNMNFMFYYATNFNQAIGNWNIALATNMIDIFKNSGLSTYNYDNTLIAWDAAGFSNKNLGNAAPLKYCAATSQRNFLMFKAWIITGDEPAQNELYSTNSGAWNNANTWCYQRVPLATDAVTIIPGHIISVPTGTFPVKNIVNNGTVSFNTGGQIQLNQ